MAKLICLQCSKQIKGNLMLHYQVTHKSLYKAIRAHQACLLTN